MDFSDLEDALYDWVVAASGLNGNNVIWSDEEGSSPSGTYMVLRIGPMLQLGAFDAHQLIIVEGETDPTKDLEFRTLGQREFALEIQCFGDQTTGDSSAFSALSKVQDSLSLPSTIEALGLKNISPFDIGQIENKSAVKAADFEGRSVLEVRFYTFTTASDFLGYIEAIDVKDESTNKVYPIPDEE